MKHTIEVKIYYEDTDCGGVIYYANYLKYFERARTDYLEAHGLFLQEFMKKGIYFVVVDASVHYHSPGRYGDILIIESKIAQMRFASLTFQHVVRRKLRGELLAKGEVKIASVSEELKPIGLPESIVQSLKL